MAAMPAFIAVSSLHKGKCTVFVSWGRGWGKWPLIWTSFGRPWNRRWDELVWEGEGVCPQCGCQEILWKSRDGSSAILEAFRSSFGFENECWNGRSSKNAHSGLKTHSFAQTPVSAQGPSAANTRLLPWDSSSPSSCLFNVLALDLNKKAKRSLMALTASTFTCKHASASKVSSWLAPIQSLSAQN